MMEIYLDGQKIDFEDTENDSTIGTLVGALEEQLKASRRFICILNVDGEELDDWRNEMVLKRYLVGFKKLELTSATVETIALEGVDVLENYLKVVLENVNRCVDGIRLGGSPVDVSVVVVLDGMTEVVKTMHELSLGGKNYDITIFRSDPAVYYKRVLDCLETVKEARDSVDNVLLGDVLEYELKGLIEEMLSALFAEKGS